MHKETFDKLQELKAAGKWVEIVAMMTGSICSTKDEADEFGLRLWRTDGLRHMGDELGAEEDVDWLLAHIDCASSALRNYGIEDDNQLKQDLYRCKGRILYQKDKNEEAISYFNKVLEQNAHFATAYRERGCCYYAMGDVVHAQEDLMSYFRENPEEAAKVTGSFDAKGTE